MNILISIVLLIVVWTQVPDFSNPLTTTQEVHEQKWFDLAELKQLISTIIFFQLGARTKELKTIKVKLKNQLKEMESKWLKRN